jgi:hypothetical protein
MPHEERAAPEKKRPAKADTKKEEKDSSEKKSSVKDSRKREPEKSQSAAKPKSPEKSQSAANPKSKEDAERALLQVERARTYLAANPPSVPAIEKQKLPVIAGQPMPEDIELYPLPQEVASRSMSRVP